MYSKNEIIGFVEFELQGNKTAEILYFGLTENYIGKGIGNSFLSIIIYKIFEYNITRLLLHTCEYDHKRAISVYKKAGFKIYNERIDYEFYPENFINKK